MAGKKNAFYSNSFLIFITRFFPSLVNLAVMVYFSKRLPAEVYGNYNNFWIHLNVFYPFIFFGLHAFVTTYAPGTLLRLLKNIKFNQYLVFAGWGVALSSSFAMLQSTRLDVSFWVSFLFILGYAFTFVLESVIMAMGNFSLLIAVNVAYSLAYWLIHYSVLKDAASISLVFLLLLITIVLKVLVYIVYVGIKQKSREGDIEPVSAPEIAKARSLWFHLGLYDNVQNLSLWIDKFAISLLFTSGVSAVYFNGSQNIPFIPLLIGAAGNAILIQLAGGNVSSEKEQTVALMNQSGRVLSCIVFPVFFFLLAYSHELFAIIFPRYEASVPIFIASLFILPVRAYNFTTVLQRMHKGAIINKGAIGEILLAILLMYPLYMWLGLPGLALSFVVSTYLQAAYYVSQTGKLLQVSAWQLLPVSNWLVKFVVVGAVLFGLHYFVGPHFTGFAALFAGGGVMMVVMGGSLVVEMRKGK